MMTPSEKYLCESQNVRQIIESLKTGRVYEIQNTPGLPRVSTVGGKLKRKI